MPQDIHQQTESARSGAATRRRQARAFGRCATWPSTRPVAKHPKGASKGICHYGRGHPLDAPARGVEGQVGGRGIVTRPMGADIGAS